MPNDELQTLISEHRIDQTRPPSIFNLGTVNTTSVQALRGESDPFVHGSLLLYFPLRRARHTIPSHFTAVFERENGWWLAHIQEMPNVLTQGRTLEEARENLKEAFTLVLETQREMAEEETAGRDVVREEFIVSD